MYRERTNNHEWKLQWTTVLRNSPRIACVRHWKNRNLSHWVICGRLVPFPKGQILIQWQCKISHLASCIIMNSLFLIPNNERGVVGQEWMHVAWELSASAELDPTNYGGEEVHRLCPQSQGVFTASQWQLRWNIVSWSANLFMCLMVGIVLTWVSCLFLSSAVPSYWNNYCSRTYGLDCVRRLWQEMTGTDYFLSATRQCLSGKP